MSNTQLKLISDVKRNMIGYYVVDSLNIDTMVSVYQNVSDRINGESAVLYIKQVGAMYLCYSPLSEEYRFLTSYHSEDLIDAINTVLATVNKGLI